MWWKKEAAQDPELSTVHPELYFCGLIGWPCCLPHLPALKEHKLPSIHTVSYPEILAKVSSIIGCIHPFFFIHFFLLLLTFNQYRAVSFIILRRSCNCPEAFDKAVTVSSQYVFSFCIIMTQVSYSKKHKNERSAHMCPLSILKKGHLYHYKCEQ